MGAFFLSSERYDTSRLRDIFAKKGFAEPTILTTSAGKVLLYRKQLLNESNFKRFADGLVFSVGAVFYEGLPYKESLALIYERYVEGRLDASKLIGNYFIYLEHDGRCVFLTDKGGIQNVFFHLETGIISSSFLAVLTALGEAQGRQLLNLHACREIITTGSLIGPDTLINGIERFERTFHGGLPGIPSMERKAETATIAKRASEFSKEVENQIEGLRAYFRTMHSVFDHYGVLTGLTGGFDSRLLYLLLRNSVCNYQIYSTYRDRPSREFSCAKILAEEAGDVLLSPRHISPEKMEQDELMVNLRDNFYFNDGLIRTHQLWLEEIKGRRYLKKLYRSNRIGFSGVGGEQYRNGQSLMQESYSFVPWVRYELVHRISGESIVHPDVRQAFYFKLQEKIAILLGLGSNVRRISTLQIKRYYNEIWNPANRTIRNNVENQMAFFISPFTDPCISRTAYAAVPYLGYGPEFEQEMIRRVAPHLAHCRTDYGFAPAECTPSRFKYLAYLKSTIGLSAYNRLYRVRKKSGGAFLNSLLSRHPALGKYIEATRSLDAQLNMKELKSNDFLSPLLVETGFFLIEMGPYIRYA